MTTVCCQPGCLAPPDSGIGAGIACARHGREYDLIEGSGRCLCGRPAVNGGACLDHMMGASALLRTREDVLTSCQEPGVFLERALTADEALGLFYILCPDCETSCRYLRASVEKWVCTEHGGFLLPIQRKEAP